jgi:hypothetical protein
MEHNKDSYLVYENWQADKKVVVHKSTCGHAKEGNNRLQDYTAPNDRWFGYFKSAGQAIAFAALFPDRQMRLCSFCMKIEKD